MFYSFEIIFFLLKNKKNQKGKRIKWNPQKAKKTQSKKFIKTKNSQKNLKKQTCKNFVAYFYGRAKTIQKKT